MSQESSGGGQRNLGCLGLIVLLIVGAVLIALGGDPRTVTSQLLEIGAGTEVIEQVEQRADDSPPPQISQSGLPIILYADLPPEAHDTITLIEENGPFPYDRDGIVFENREGILPDEEYGYYHEYTVITPGENDRGARRIVTGEDGQFYYTDDHYDSFSEVAF